MFKHQLLRVFGLVLPFMIYSLLSASVANARSDRGETHICYFQKAGKVLIDTRARNSSIIYKGRRYAARGGSYFYQTDSDMTLAFNPSMTQWTIMRFSQDGTRTEKSVRCSKVRNQK